MSKIKYHDWDYAKEGDSSNERSEKACNKIGRKGSKKSFKSHRAKPKKQDYRRY